MDEHQCGFFFSTRMWRLLLAGVEFEMESSVWVRKGGWVLRGQPLLFS